MGVQGSGSRVGGPGLHPGFLDVSLGTTRPRPNCLPEPFCTQNFNLGKKRLCAPFCSKVGHKSSKTLPKWSQMGSKINLFSNLPKKSFFGFYSRNNHIPTVLGRPFFTLCPVIFLQKRGLRTGTPTNHSKFAFFLTKVQNCAKRADTPSTGVGEITPFSHLFTKVHPLGSKGVPG